MAPERPLSSEEEEEGSSEEEVEASSEEEASPSAVEEAETDRTESDDEEDPRQKPQLTPSRNKTTPSNPVPALATLAAAAAGAEEDDDDSGSEDHDNGEEDANGTRQMHPKKKKETDPAPSRTHTPARATSKVMGKAQPSAVKTTTTSAPPKRASDSKSAAADSVELPPSKKAKVASDRGNFLKPKVNNLWSPDDKVAILDGMIRFKEKEGSFPNAKTMDVFHEFISDSITPGRKKDQLSNKIKKLKELYNSNVQKGEAAVFSTPQDLKSFELSKTIWAAELAIVPSPGSNNNRKGKKVAGNSGIIEGPKGESMKGTAMLNEGLEVGADSSTKDVRLDPNLFWYKFPRFQDAMHLELSGMLDFERSAEMESMSKISIVKANKIEEQLKSIRAKEIELNIQLQEVHRERQDVYQEVKRLRLSFL